MEILLIWVATLSLCMHEKVRFVPDQGTSWNIFLLRHRFYRSQDNKKGKKRAIYKNGAEETLFLLFLSCRLSCTNSIRRVIDLPWEKLMLIPVPLPYDSIENIYFSVCYYRVNVFSEQNCVLHFYLHLWVIIVFTYFHYILWRMDKWNNFYYFWVFQWTFYLYFAKKNHRSFSCIWYSLAQSQNVININAFIWIH